MPGGELVEACPLPGDLPPPSMMVMRFPTAVLANLTEKDRGVVREEVLGYVLENSELDSDDIDRVVLSTATGAPRRRAPPAGLDVTIFLKDEVDVETASDAAEAVEAAADRLIVELGHSQSLAANKEVMALAVPGTSTSTTASGAADPTDTTSVSSTVPSSRNAPGLCSLALSDTECTCPAGTKKLASNPSVIGVLHDCLDRPLCSDYQYGKAPEGCVCPVWEAKTSVRLAYGDRQQSFICVEAVKGASAVAEDVGEPTSPPGEASGLGAGETAVIIVAILVVLTVVVVKSAGKSAKATDAPRLGNDPQTFHYENTAFKQPATGSRADLDEPSAVPDGYLDIHTAATVPDYTESTAPGAAHTVGNFTVPYEDDQRNTSA